MPYFARNGDLDLDEMLGGYLRQSNVVMMRNIRTGEPMNSAVSSGSIEFNREDANFTLHVASL
jgi:hypothetical protein